MKNIYKSVCRRVRGVLLLFEMSVVVAAALYIAVSFGTLFYSISTVKPDACSKPRTNFDTVFPAFRFGCWLIEEVKCDDKKKKGKR